MPQTGFNNLTAGSNLNCFTAFEWPNQVDHGVNSLGMTVSQTSNSNLSGFVLVCAPLAQHRCSSLYKSHGSCYLATQPRTQLWQRKDPCFKGCSMGLIDMMFVIDGSLSVKQVNFDKVKEWIKQVTRTFDISGPVQVGVVQNSTYNPRTVDQPYIKTEIGLGQYRNETIFNETVHKMQYQRRTTWTAHAILKTVNEDFKGPNNRFPNVRRMMVLLTDGISTDKEDLPRAVAYSKNEGVETFAVGVRDLIVLNELELIAGGKERVITVEKFSELFSIVRKLQDDIRILEGEEVGAA